MGQERRGDSRRKLEELGFVPGFPDSSPKVLARRGRTEEARVEGIVEGSRRSVIVVRDMEEYKRRKSFPTLAGTNRISDVRYDPQGRIYASWYRGLETFETFPSRKSVRIPEGVDFSVLHPRRVSAESLVSLPKGKKVYELILGRVENGVEAAMRQQMHILDSYSPGSGAREVLFARDIMEFTEGIMAWFVLKGGVAKSDLVELANRTAGFLTERGIFNPSDPRKRAILEGLLTVPLQDSAGRANYLVLLERVGAAHTLAVERLTISALAAEKSERNLRVLTVERENTRWRLRQVVGHMENILNHRVFSNASFGTETQVKGLENAISFLATQYLSKVRVRPYLEVAREVGITMVGCRDSKKPANREILGPKKADGLFEKPPVTRLIREDNIPEAHLKISSCMVMIEEVLEKYAQV